MQRLVTYANLVAAGYVSNRTTLRRRILRGDFPAPIRVGPRNIAWLKTEIDAWEAKRITDRDSASRGEPLR